jgi:hypothetical protein
LKFLNSNAIRGRDLGNLGLILEGAQIPFNKTLLKRRKRRVEEIPMVMYLSLRTNLSE